MLNHNDKAKRFLYFVVTLTSSIASIVTILAIAGTTAVLAYVAVLLVAFAVYSAYSAGRAWGQFAHQLASEYSFRFALPKDIKAVYNIDAHSFTSRDLISENAFALWRKKNRRAFLCLFYKSHVVGYCSVLGLTEDALQRFVSGTQKESDFAPADLLSASQLNDASSVYLFSLAITPRHRGELNDMLWRVVLELDAMRRHGRLRRVYASAATREGARLLRRFGFSCIQRACERADAHDLYVRKLDPRRSLLAAYVRARHR